MRERILEGTPLQETISTMELEAFSDEDEDDALVDVARDVQNIMPTGAFIFGPFSRNYSLNDFDDNCGAKLCVRNRITFPWCIQNGGCRPSCAVSRGKL